MNLMILNYQCPALDKSQVSTIYPHIAEALFGREAFIDDSRALHADVLRFVEVFMHARWPVYKRAIQNERIGVEKKEAALNKSWQGQSHTPIRSSQCADHHIPIALVFSCQADKKATAEVVSNVRKWMSQMDGVIAIQSKYHDKESTAHLRHKREQLNDLLSAMDPADDKKPSKTSE